MSFENRYSFTERLLHRLAFATPRLQIDYAEADDEAFAKVSGAARADRPVFIAALPRAGTTLLLDLCAERPDFATHTYRHMPFLFTPLLWRRFSGRFQRDDAPRERAHGDGMMVSADSPEAFEEMLWKAFWPNHYKADRIVPWTTEDGAAFKAFFQRHMAKIAALGATDPARPPRYISKNNGNIARLGWLAKAIPDAAFIVPFREPLSHAGSLHHQHLNFLSLHAKDRFSREYMAGVGHFDFGANLKPIDFDGWLAPGAFDATQPDFWLRYWIAAYGHILREHAERVMLVDYDALCEAPKTWLGAIGARLELEPGAFDEAAGKIRNRPSTARPELFDAALADQARGLHDQLQQAARSRAA
ncbi:sulfotransferase [Phenylobacterium sp.]|uniref:sulfotransferase n=1 Tax=Phenylobacterium sp. TaxID=1871053 RepID=UPI0035B01B5F